MEIHIARGVSTMGMHTDSLQELFGNPFGNCWNKLSHAHPIYARGHILIPRIGVWIRMGEASVLEEFLSAHGGL